MKTLGLIGGMSWESSAWYYRFVNEAVRERLGPLASAQLLMWSFNFADLESAQASRDWARAGAMLVSAAQRLERGGAELLVICANTMHKVADRVEAEVDLPIVHIADATGRAVAAAGLERVGLLGTIFTMEEDFYRGRMRDRYGIETVVPDKDDRLAIHRVIYEELCAGIVSEGSRAMFARVNGGLVDRGAQGVVLGCTEIPLLVRPEDVSVPVFDTTRIHALAAVEAAFQTE